MTDELQRRRFERLSEEQRRRLARLSEEQRASLIEQALRLCRRDHARADDLVQDCLLRACLHLDSLADESKVSAWLCRILRNLWVDVCRKRRASIPISDLLEDLAHDPDPGAGDSDGGEPPLWESVTPDDFRAALDQLKEPYRSVVILHDIDHVPNAEIARRLDIRYGTVGTRLHRAHKKVKKLLQRQIADRRRKETSR